MRAVSELISDIRFSTNETKNLDRFPDTQILNFINRAQDYIEMIAFAANPDMCVVEKSKKYEISGGAQKLPNDQLGLDSVIYVRYGERSYLDRIDIKEGGFLRGYYLHKNRIYFAGIDSGTAEVFYVAKLPRLSNVNDTSSLPTACEGFLIEYVERKINAINSSKDIQSSLMFSEEEKKIIVALLSDNNREMRMPVMLNTDYVTWW